MLYDCKFSYYRCYKEYPCVCFLDLGKQDDYLIMLWTTRKISLTKSFVLFKVSNDYSLVLRFNKLVALQYFYLLRICQHHNHQMHVLGNLPNVLGNLQNLTTFKKNSTAFQICSAKARAHSGKSAQMQVELNWKVFKTDGVG